MQLREDRASLAGPGDLRWISLLYAQHWQGGHALGTKGLLPSMLQVAR